MRIDVGIIRNQQNVDPHHPRGILGSQQFKKVREISLIADTSIHFLTPGGKFFGGQNFEVT